MKNKISFVIPAKNEEKSIPILYKEIISVLKKLKLKYEIIFIDDGSTDNTLANIKKIVARDKNVKVIKHRGNFGKSVALQNGFAASSGNLVFTMDADLQDDPKEIPAFLSKIDEGFDMVTGWKSIRKDPISKTLPSKVINFLVRAMTGLNIHDINCGFKVYKKETLSELNLYGDLYRFIPIFLYRKSYKIAEISVKHNARKYGKSKYGWKRFISGWLDLLTVFFLVRYLRRPGHFFGTIGLFLFSLGFLIGLYITYLRITTGGISYHQPLLILGILLIIIGVQLLSIGLLAEMLLFQRPKIDYKSYIEELR